MPAKKTIIQYDGSLPEIPDRDPTLEPVAHLRRVGDSYEIVAERRASEMLLVDRVRSTVDQWRTDGYPGASDTTRRLFAHWFEESPDPEFRLYWGQREAIETIVYLTEIRARPDVGALIDRFAPSVLGTLVDKPYEIEELVDGSRQLIRSGEDGERYRVSVPPEQLARYALKLATGAGKTLLMALVITWAYFHKRREKDSPLSTNFLVLAPNVIVFDRLRSDFEARKVFEERSLVPPGWILDLKVVLRGDPAEPSASGNLFVTNIQQLYDREDADVGAAAVNAVDALLGRAPAGDPAKGRRMLDRVRDLSDVIALNDEAHHVHDDDLEWNKTLLALNEALPGGVPLWLDFSATPKDQAGNYFPWIVCDYPLAQAVEDRIVKAPLVVKGVDEPGPAGVTKKNVLDKYEPWLKAGLSRFHEHEKAYKALPGVRPVMFVMTENISHADAIGEWFIEQPGVKDEHVLVIHTDSEGQIRKGELDELRDQARRIDEPASPVRIVVSVLVLREGWDVRNVTMVLGLRPGNAAAGILPEQAVGRGLRLMPQGADWRQTLEVMGTPAFEEFVRQLEVEGVPISETKKPPKPVVVIAPEKSRLSYDIEIPRTGAQVERSLRDLSSVDPLAIDPVFTPDEVDGVLKGIRVKIEDPIHDDLPVGDAVIAALRPMLPEELIADIAGKAQRNAGLTDLFREVAPIVKQYLQLRAFGETVDLGEDDVRVFLGDAAKRERVAKQIGYALGAATVKQADLKVESVPLRLSETKPFPWRRDWTRATKTVFNYVATFNALETNFGEFLDSADDVIRFSALAEYSTGFFVEYLKPMGAVGRYFPDWVVVQDGPDGRDHNWIIETKGRVWEGTEAKDAAIKYWCEQVTEKTGEPWEYMRVDQVVFDAGGFDTLAELADRVRASGDDEVRMRIFSPET